jgi:hypothetical protein
MLLLSASDSLVSHAESALHLNSSQPPLLHPRVHQRRPGPFVTKTAIEQQGQPPLLQGTSERGRNLGSLGKSLGTVI